MIGLASILIYIVACQMSCLCQRRISLMVPIYSIVLLPIPFGTLYWDSMLEVPRLCTTHEAFNEGVKESCPISIQAYLLKLELYQSALQQTEMNNRIGQVLKMYQNFGNYLRIPSFNKCLTIRQVQMFFSSHSSTVPLGNVCLQCFLLSNKCECLSSGCGSIGKVVASDTRDLWFKSSHRQNFILNIFTVNC